MSVCFWSGGVPTAIPAILWLYIIYPVVRSDIQWLCLIYLWFYLVSCGYVWYHVVFIKYLNLAIPMWCYRCYWSYMTINYGLCHKGRTICVNKYRLCQLGCDALWGRTRTVRKKKMSHRSRLFCDKYLCRRGGGIPGPDRLARQIWLHKHTNGDTARKPIP